VHHVTAAALQVIAIKVVVEGSASNCSSVTEKLKEIAQSFLNTLLKSRKKLQVIAAATSYCSTTDYEFRIECALTVPANGVSYDRRVIGWDEP